jgi:alanine racemase
MDALMVDITDIPQAQMWDEAVLMGKQGGDEITVRDIAKLKNSVTYDVLTNWRLRLRRKSVNGKQDETQIARIGTDSTQTNSC